MSANFFDEPAPKRPRHAAGAEQSEGVGPPSASARSSLSPPSDADWIFRGCEEMPGAEMAERMRNLDWSKTPMGPVETWPSCLKLVISLCLKSRFPLELWWGPDFIHLYNDAYKPILTKHQHNNLLARPGREVWSEIWEIIAPLLQGVRDTGIATFVEDQLLCCLRNDGKLAERYFTYSYSPIQGETGTVDGIFTAVRETTSEVVSQRQLRTLHAMAARSLQAKTSLDACAVAVDCLAQNPTDVPVAGMYLVGGPHNSELRRIRVAGIEQESLFPELVQLNSAAPELSDSADDWPQRLSSSIALAASGGTVITVPVAESVCWPPCGAWNEPPSLLLALPLTSAGSADPVAVLVCGVNTRCWEGDDFRAFFSLVAQQASTTIGNARAQEEAQHKAEALAELDRAKTVFFSNVSHEFRTPLTLMLGPLEDIIGADDPKVPTGVKEQLSLVHRNTLRLLKLANTLLDFSRIQAGRVRACYEPVDLAIVTSDLAGMFRSACERHKLKFEVICPSLPEAIYIDREMWEKIVLNLLSNAYKYTSKGSITLRLEYVGSQNRVDVFVQDTGCGISEEDLPHVCDRFYRSRNQPSYAHEGTGIGLALVQELVKLHGGSLRIESQVGVGTKMTVSIPTGFGHLPAEAVRHSGPDVLGGRLRSHLQDITYWVTETTPPLSSDTSNEVPPSPSPGSSVAGGDESKYLITASDSSDEQSPAQAPAVRARARVLLADDNADMLGYIKRLLQDTYDVEAVMDGEAALRAVKQRLPDIVLSDIMMPRLDGIGLLKQLRSDQATAAVPVVFLSARAGEEARIEGLEAGADEYLVKPFSAKELQARVAAVLNMSRIRLAAAARERELRDIAESASRAKDQLLATLSHELRTPLTPALMLNDMLLADDTLPQQVRNDLQTIGDNIRLEMRLVDDLLDMTKITRQKLVLHLQPADIHKLIRSALIIVQQDVEAKNLKVALRLEAARQHVMADPSRLQQVFWNLIKNSVKFTPEAGRIEIRSRNEPDGSIAVDVVDTGRGIDGETLPELFRPFHQGSSEVTKQYGGLGLGLAISHAIARLHKGTLEASSDGIGHGATFTFRMPTGVDTESGDGGKDETVGNPLLAPIAASSSAELSRSLRVLVVDDNRGTVLVLNRLLRDKLGHQVESAMTGNDAVRIATQSETPFDLLVCDVGLPDISGLDVVRQIRAVRPQTRAIACSGYGTEEDIANSIAAGFEHHLVKPVQVRQFSQTLRSMFRDPFKEPASAGKESTSPPE